MELNELRNQSIKSENGKQKAQRIWVSYFRLKGNDEGRQVVFRGKKRDNPDTSKIFKMYKCAPLEETVTEVDKD